MRVTFLLLLITLIFAAGASAQPANADLRRGNKSFSDGQFQNAEQYYRRGLEKSPSDVRGLYNLANTLYRQGRFEEASNILEGLAGMDVDAEKRADILHNLGNARMAEKKIEDGVQAYKESLRISPEDAETRHNLAYALRLLQQQQQQQNQDNQNQNNDNRQQQSPPDQPQGNQGQPQPQQSRISPQDAERMLNALNKQEQNIQERLERNDQNIVSSRVLKDW